MAYDIFISYKRKGTSSATAAYLYELLLRKGYNVFFDRKEMRSGKFNDQLLEHISNAQDVIILLEHESLQSWFDEKDKLQKAARKDNSEQKGLREPQYKGDWYCREVIHALSQPGKNIIPLLLNGYQMPEAKDLPPEMKDLPMMQSLSLDISEIEETYQKYFVEKEYLKSKPRNLALSRQYQSKGGVVGSFLFYTDVPSCELYECGEKIITLTDDNDEQHPFRYPVTFAGEHRFYLMNNDTCEELFVREEVNTNCQKYIGLQWKETQNLWELTDEQIEAQDDVKLLYRWGKGLFDGTVKNEPNIEISLKCLKRAIALGSKEALALITANGSNLITKKKAPDEIAFEWYQIAAENGNPDAQWNIGRSYFWGDWYTLDYMEAMKWFRMAAEKGHTGSMVAIGIMYRTGQGVDQDFRKAMEWYLKAAEQGETFAMKTIGDMYGDGQGVEQDYHKAMEWYLKAAEQGDASSMEMIGLMYSEGLSVEQDYAKAMEWYLKAAEQGDAYAMGSIGCLYLEGLGVEQDDAKAMEWCLKAAEQGDTPSMGLIGFMYSEGLSVEQDYAKAIEWYLKAAEQGNTFSYNEIARTYHLMDKHEEALPWAEKAVETDPDNPNIIDTIATVYQGLGRYDEALEQWKRCITILSDNPEENADFISDVQEKIRHLKGMMRK